MATFGLNHLSTIKAFASRPRCRSVAAFLLIFSPAWVLAWLVAHHAVNIPVWDGWERALMLEKWNAGTLTFADLYAPHIDHRIVFPRLVILAVATLAQGDVRWEIGMTWLFGLATGIGVWKLGRVTLGPGVWAGGVAFLANLWIFSPLQYDNWLWPIQTAFVLPLPCLVWALYVAVRPWAWSRRLLVAASLAIIGTHSFSHGLFIWPAVGMLILLLPKSDPAATGKGRFLIGWTGLAVMVIGCYFLVDYKVATDYSYGSQMGDPTPLAGTWRNALAQFDGLWKFFLTMLGSPLVRQFAVDPFRAAAAFGWLSLGAYAAAGLWAVFRWKSGDAESWSRALPWLALGGAVIAISLGASLGRSMILAPARASAPRLLTITLHLPITFLALALLAGRYRLLPMSGGGFRWPVALLGGLIALQIQPWIHGVRLMGFWQISRLQAQAQVRFIEHFTPEPARILAYHAVDVKRFAPILDRLGLLDPPLVKSLRLDQFSISDKVLAASKGGIESAALQPDGGWKLEGYAILRGPSRPADALLITAESPDAPDPVIIALGACGGNQLPTRHRIDLQFSVMEELNERDPGSWMRWVCSVDPASLASAGPLTIRAWAFDQTKRRVYPLPQRLVIGPDGSGRLLDR